MTDATQTYCMICGTINDKEAREDARTMARMVNELAIAYPKEPGSTHYKLVRRIMKDIRALIEKGDGDGNV